MKHDHFGFNSVVQAADFGDFGVSFIATVARFHERRGWPPCFRSGRSCRIPDFGAFGISCTATVAGLWCLPFVINPIGASENDPGRIEFKPGTNPSTNPV